MRVYHISNEYKSYAIKYKIQRNVTRLWIRSELLAALHMTTSGDYKTYTTILKLLNRLVDVPNTAVELNKFWNNCKNI
jgi:hypothetical protein